MVNIKKSFTPHLLEGKKERISSKPLKKGEGFTLIELLVVIFIIGLLSSIVLISVKSVRDKARIAGSQVLHRSVHTKLSLESTGNWGFDNTLDDTSGNGLNFSCMGDCDFQEGISGQGVQITAGSSLKIALSSALNNKSGAITIQTWLKRNGSGEDLSIVKGLSFRINNLSDFGLGIKIYESTDFCALLITDHPLMDGGWHHLLVTYNGINTLKVYIDGVEISSRKDCSGHINNSLFGLTIGDNSTEIIVDEFMIYDETFLE